MTEVIITENITSVVIDGGGTVVVSEDVIEVVTVGTQGPAGSQGIEGPQGDAGSAGQGVPAGGTTGQILRKRSNSDFDTEWFTPTIDVL